nr:5591_t:CDS:2 [Entrophospora candida]
MGLACKVFVVIISVLVFIAVALSFLNVELNVPKQTYNRLTGYPVWHPVIDGYDQTQLDALSVFVEVVMAIGAYIGYHTIKNKPKSKKYSTIFYEYNDGHSKRKRHRNDELYYLIVIYIITTIVSGFIYAIFDIGKLFGMVAVNHNILEYVLIVWILSGGKINYSKWYAFFFIHLLIVGVLTIFLKWPYDAIAFRIQGLTLDILLFTELTRTYFTTLCNLKRKNRIALVDDASFIHGLGNTINTFYYAQQTPYSLAFALYAYYIYVDTRIPASPYSKKIIYLPNNSSYITFAIIVLTLSFSLLVVRISVLIESKHDNSG